MQTILLHGVAVETTDQGAAAVAGLKAELTSAVQKVAARDCEIEAINARHATELAALGPQTLDAETLDAAVASRIAVIDAAKAIMGAEFDPRKKSEMMIRRLVAARKLGEAKLAGKDDAFVTVVFDTLVATMVDTNLAQGSLLEGISSAAATKAYDRQIGIHNKLNGVAHGDGRANIDAAVRLSFQWVRSAISGRNHRSDPV